jgi:C4-dicarboxylate-binding protein DctP
MKKMIVAMMLAALGGLLGSPAMAQKMQIRLAHHMPLTNHMHISALQLAKYFNERSKDAEIKVFGAGQLYTERGLVQAVQAGAVEMVFTTASWWGGTTPSINVLNAPMLLTTYDKARAAITGKMGQALAAELEKNGVKIVGWIDSGVDAVLVNNAHPIKTVEDFKGLRLRSAFPMTAEVFKELGAGAVVMSSSEVYMALQRGTFDGTLSGAPSVADRKWMEVTKYCTHWPLYFSSQPVAVNRDFWNKLSPENQKLLLEAATVAGNASRHRAEEAEQASWAKIKKLLTPIELEPAAQEKLAHVGEQVSIKYLKQTAGETGIRIYNLAKEDIKGVK